MTQQSLERNIQWSAVFYILNVNESTITGEKLSVMNWLLYFKYQWVDKHCRKSFSDELTVTFLILMSRQSLPIYFQWWTDLHFKNEWVHNHCREIFTDQLSITFWKWMSRQSLPINFQCSTDYYILNMNESTITAEKLSVMNWLLHLK